MKSVVAGLLIALSLAGTAWAGDHYVRGYSRKDGTYVAPHYQTNPNSTTSDNYSTRGNINPYTGQPGTKPDTRPAYGAYSTPSYSQPSYGAPARQPDPYGSSPDDSPYGSTPESNCQSSFGC